MNRINEIRELEGDGAIAEIVEVLNEADLDFIWKVYKRVCTPEAVMNEKSTKLIVKERV